MQHASVTFSEDEDTTAVEQILIEKDLEHTTKNYLSPPHPRLNQFVGCSHYVESDDN